MPLGKVDQSFLAEQQEVRNRFRQLTPRKRQVALLLPKLRSPAAIARELVLTANAVSHHLTQIYRTLQVTDRHQAIWMARVAGLDWLRRLSRKDAPP